MDAEHFALALAGKTPEQIKMFIEGHLKNRLEAATGLYTEAGKPKQIALREQAAFIAGALAALGAVFGDSGDDTFKPPISGIAFSWTISVTRGEFVFHDGA